MSDLAPAHRQRRLSVWTSLQLNQSQAAEDRTLILWIWEGNINIHLVAEPIFQAPE